LQREAPFITKALKLVSLSLIVATVAIAATAAYSGYEEYGALTSSIGTTGEATASLNGSTLQISGLDVPNRMTFPLTLELQGVLSINNVSIGTFDSGAYVILPNQSKNINISIPLNYDDLLNNSQLLNQTAFNSSELGITTTISAHMVPLLGINITRLVNMTAGPYLGDLSASLNESAATIGSNGSLNLPVVLNWQNTSPLTQGSFWIQANLTQIPGRPTGNYGSASGPLNLTSGHNSQSLDFNLPLSDFGRNPPRGTYSIQIVISQSKYSQPFLQFVKTVNV
jgi:hypothetical protein